MVEGEDPRIYNKIGKVDDVKDEEPPEWSISVPWIPRMWRKKFETDPMTTNSDLGTHLVVTVVDVAWYSNKVHNLLDVIRRCNPTTLIIDWCHTRGGNVLKEISASGLASRIVLENELYFVNRSILG